MIYGDDINELNGGTECTFGTLQAATTVMLSSGEKLVLNDVQYTPGEKTFYHNIASWLTNDSTAFLEVRISDDTLILLTRSSVISLSVNVPDIKTNGAE